MEDHFKLDKLINQSIAMLGNKDIDGRTWMIGNAFVDPATAELKPQLLDFVDSINSTPGQEAKAILAETAARIIAISMLKLVRVGLDDHLEDMVEHAQIASQTTEQLIKKVAERP